jgi:Spy/CpxP family protein refolding chaperone
MNRSAVISSSAGRWALFAAAGTAALLLAAPQALWAGPRSDAPRIADAMRAGADGVSMAGWGMHPRLFEHMAGELELSDAQRQSIRGLFESARPAMQQRREQMRANAELMRRTQPGDRDYQAVVERVSRSAGELASSAVSDAAQLRAQIWAVLTPEQRTKMQQLQEQRRSQREERRKLRQERMEQRRGGGKGAPGGMAPPQG